MLRIVMDSAGDLPAEWVKEFEIDINSAIAISESVNDFVNIKDMFIEDLSIAIATLLGPDTVGIVAYPVEEGVS